MKKQILKYVVAPGILLVFLSAFGLIGQESGTKRLKVNTGESKVNWIGKKPAKEHKGYVKLLSGELLVDRNEIKGGTFVIDMNTIADADLNDNNMNSKLVSHLKSADFFDVQKFPTAKFVITQITKQKNAKTTHRIEGDLTMKGITREIGFDASVNILKGKFTASTPPFTINRTQWGVNYQSKSVFSELIDQFIYDDITLSIDLVSD